VGWQVTIAQHAVHNGRGGKILPPILMGIFGLLVIWHDVRLEDFKSEKDNFPISIFGRRGH
jgi:hypothetical protein